MSLMTGWVRALQSHPPHVRVLRSNDNPRCLGAAEMSEKRRRAEKIVLELGSGE